MVLMVAPVVDISFYVRIMKGWRKVEIVGDEHRGERTYIHVGIMRSRQHDVTDKIRIRARIPRKMR